MGKNLIIGALFVAVLGLAYLNFWPKSAVAPVNPQGETQGNTEICAQVITPAVDPNTGDIREFPSPCEVPEGWEIIQNDIPGLDLEVQ